jgi:hypothetical protein
MTLMNITTFKSDFRKGNKKDVCSNIGLQTSLLRKNRLDF